KAGGMHRGGGGGGLRLPLSAPFGERGGRGGAVWAALAPGRERRRLSRQSLARSVDAPGTSPTEEPRPMTREANALFVSCLVLFPVALAAAFILKPVVVRVIVVGVVLVLLALTSLFPPRVVTAM